MSSAAPDPVEPGFDGYDADEADAGDEADDADEAGAGGPSVPTFPPKPFLRLGYDRGAVDQFVTMVVLAVHNERQTSVSADDVLSERFPGRRLGRGYRMHDVDEYLAAAEALLRMRESARGSGLGPGPHEVPAHRHPRTWWIYAVAVVLALAIVVFTLIQT